MKVLEIILPVLVMILLGMACKRLKLLDQNGINNMKLLVTQIMLPVAIFHALATAEYNKETGILILIMFVMLVVSFGLGFLLKPFLNGTYQKYLPFMVSVYEGGLMAYPLYTRDRKSTRLNSSHRCGENIFHTLVHASERTV